MTGWCSALLSLELDMEMMVSRYVRQDYRRCSHIWSQVSFLSPVPWRDEPEILRINSLSASDILVFFCVFSVPVAGEGRNVNVASKGYVEWL